MAAAAAAPPRLVWPHQASSRARQDGDPRRAELPRGAPEGKGGLRGQGRGTGPAPRDTLLEGAGASLQRSGLLRAPGSPSLPRSHVVVLTLE